MAADAWRETLNKGNTSIFWNLLSPVIPISHRRISHGRHCSAKIIFDFISRRLPDSHLFSETKWSWKDVSWLGSPCSCFGKRSSYLLLTIFHYFSPCMETYITSYEKTSALPFLRDIFYIHKHYWAVHHSDKDFSMLATILFQQLATQHFGP